MLAVNFRNLALGHEVLERPDGVFVRNRSLPRIYDANFVFDVLASRPHEIRALLAAASEYLQGADRLTFRCDPFTPAPFESHLADEGFEPSEALVMVLRGRLSGKPVPIEIREAKTETEWSEYARLKGLDWHEHALRLKLEPDERVGQDLARSCRLKSPPAVYLLAYVEGSAVGFCQAWAGIDDVGQVEDLFVDPAWRHRGIATALLHAGVAAARSRGAGPIVIVADPADTPKNMYAALGWTVVSMCRQYGKPLTDH
jgi:ribosomal protein S18 acetylase RimI-like enzyme